MLEIIYKKNLNIVRMSQQMSHVPSSGYKHYIKLPQKVNMLKSSKKFTLGD